MSDDIDFDSFPVVRKGNGFQDFETGQEMVHHWGRTLTDGDNAIFSTATCNWNPMHLNAEFAREHGHPDVVLNPMLVLCTVVGLSVEDLSESGGPFLGMEDVTFPPTCVSRRHAERVVPGGRQARVRQPTQCRDRHLAHRSPQPARRARRRLPPHQPRHEAPSGDHR